MRTVYLTKTCLRTGRIETLEVEDATFNSDYKRGFSYKKPGEGWARRYMRDDYFFTLKDALKNAEDRRVNRIMLIERELRTVKNEGKYPLLVLQLQRRINTLREMEFKLPDPAFPAPAKYSNPVCAITGRTGNLIRWDIKNADGIPVGLVFVHPSVNPEDYTAEINMSCKVSIKASISK